MDISVVIPLLNESKSIFELCIWIRKVMNREKFSYEIIFIDDGSTDGSWGIIEKLYEKKLDIKAIRFGQSYGKSSALQVGFQKAIGEVVITMDADLQDNPEEIPILYRMIRYESYHLVSGWKKKRYDPLTKRLSTKLFNAVARSFSGINIHDFNCGLKAYNSTVVKSIELYNDMHRWIPCLVKYAGFNKIGEKIVQHQERKYGYTKFGVNRFSNGYLDLFTLWFLFKFGKKPMHFFGLIGSGMLIIGLISIIVVVVIKYCALINGYSSTLITNTPYFYIALASMIIGTQLFLTGFIGELIVRNSIERNHYRILNILE